MKKIILIIMLLFLTSCSYNEPNDIAYVVAIGFDKAENDNYDITIQFAKPTQISGGASEEGGKGGDIVENITIEAPNIYSGINVANNIVSKKFTLSHAKLIVFSREIAQNGISELIDTMVRSEELRPDTYIAVANSQAREYLTNVKPTIEVNPAKYYQLIYDRNDSGGVPKSNLQRFYFDEKTGTKCSVVPMAGKMRVDGEEEGSQEESEQGQSGGGESGSQGGGHPLKNESNKDAEINKNSFEYNIKNYHAGEVAIYNSNKGEAIGMTLFKEGKMVANLGGIDCELYNLLTGRLRKSYISFKNTISPTPITLKLNQGRKPKIDIDMKEKNIDIYLYTESDIYSIPTNYSKDKQIDKFEQEAAESINKNCEEFINYCRDEYNIDVLNIGNTIKRKFLTVDDYKSYDFENDYKNYKVNVYTDLKIRRSGMKIEDR